jgi:hypothetical protein
MDAVITTNTVIANEANTVIASEAKQSPACVGAISPGDCFASLAMTVEFARNDSGRSGLEAPEPEHQAHASRPQAAAPVCLGTACHGVEFAGR